MVYPDDGDPIVLQITDALVARLDTIQAPAYFTTVNSVVLLRNGITDGLTPPFIGVTPLADTAHDEALQFDVHQQTYFICGVQRVTDDPREQLRAGHQLLSDIRRAIQLDPQFGELAFDTNLTYQDVPTPNDGSLVECRMEALVSYRHVYADPARITYA